ncbi:MAG: hypothetical protein K2R93_05360 [Gemmatimonadaceae bacterium]|nr:hypothetical protein [Gemmatimonadaceae bacterium]
MRRLVLCALTAAACAVQAATAQSPRSIEGRVRRPMPGRGDSTGMGPAANVWVTLHRLGKDSAGPIDSVRADANGHYRLQWRPFGAPEAVYFASVTYGGIAYFAPPAKSEHASGDDGEITVFDTTSRPFPLSVKGRHLIVGKRDTGNVRTVIEVFELSNDSLQTIIATGTTTPTWSVRIPGAATNARVNSDEVSPQAFRVQNGRAEIFAPVPPGVKQVSFTYSVPESAFPLAFTAEAGAVVFEILLEDLDATVQAMGFTRVGEVTLEGRQFQRFLAQDVKPDTRLAVDVPTANAPASGALQRYGIVIAIGFFVLLLVGRRMQRSANARVNAPLPTLRTTVRDDDTEPERLRDAIRQLDAAWAKQTAPTEHLQRTYEARRQELEAALAQALAESGTAR